METRADYRSLDLRAGPIRYRQAGPDDGRPVVFVHGFLIDDTAWADVPERRGTRGSALWRRRGRSVRCGP
jgi:pimeloyl-ACP methyl ester carboxylesterase